VTRPLSFQTNICQIDRQNNSTWIVAGQMLASLVLDHFGLIGYPIHPLSGMRMLGVMMLLGGVILIRWF